MATKAKKPVKAKASKAAKVVKAAKPAVKKTAKLSKIKPAKKKTAVKKVIKQNKMPTKKTPIKTKAKIAAKPKVAKVTSKAAPKKVVRPVAKVEVKKPKPAPAPVKLVKAKTPTVSKTQKPKVKTIAMSTQVYTSSLASLDLLPYSEIAGEEYMNGKQRDHFRIILMKWKEQLMQEMDRTVHHLQDEVVNLPDPNDRATQEEEFSLELRARDRERKLTKKIEETLQKLDEGEYGYCESCGVEIGIRRLEARPTANLCIDCKTLDEIRERQMWG